MIDWTSAEAGRAPGPGVVPLTFGLRNVAACPVRLPGTITLVTDEPQLRARFAVDDVALSELHARAFARPAASPVIEVQAWRAQLERYSVSWVGAFAGEDLVGFVHACWDGGLHAFLLDTVVDPRCRRRGLGTRLVTHLVSEVRAAGCQWLHVDYEAHLESFYRAAGFGSTTAGILELR